MTWQQLYETDAQGLWAVIVAPAAFLLWRAVVRPRPDGPAARFVHLWCLVFAVETILDPLATGPLVRWLGVADGAVGQAVLFLFVYLGDFRVFLLVLGVAEPLRPPGRTIAAAAAWSCVVPVVTSLVMTLLGTRLGPLPGTVLWLVYEIAFTALALVLRRRRTAAGPAVRAFTGSILAWAAAYYALWAAADALILRGHDTGWALRMVPNQLYYALFVPFVAARYASTSRSVQAAR